MTTDTRIERPERRFMLDSGDGGLRAVIAEGGARLISLTMPDRQGGRVDMVHGTRGHDPVIAGDRVDMHGVDIHAGTICGRYANRIAGARCPIDGHMVVLAANEGTTSLHGGPEGFGQRRWRGGALPGGICFRLESAAGDQGFPGRLAVEAVYRLAGMRLSLEIAAVTDAPTVVNLSQHVYWNLAGGGTIAGHDLAIAAAHYLAVDEALLPVGAPQPVAGTRFDFRAPRRLDQSVDHNFCRIAGRGPLQAVARLSDPGSGRAMTLFTTEPGLQVYTADHFHAGLAGADRPLRHHGGVALESQAFPNSPNRPDFPSTLLRPGMAYRHDIVWDFSGPPLI
ncbi:aldose 1-epimerase [Tistrella bauzanensis]|uniref:Aldose 1-epimerase n=1 Tax=Tistrella bauzanensis TaxID=657419 RepID=A0ABQ1IGA7_9PROT|nr:aldose epimerase family protein [Tistrella bauzanensis]GGB36846.1 aldose 1-epimerase [Tistrella bauzanensis]